MKSVSFARVAQDAQLLFDRQQLEAAIRRMGREIDKVLDGEPAVLLTVMKGALVFAAQLALSIQADLTFDYVHATRYHDNQAGELRWLHRPHTDLSGRRVLLADDILDEGHTLMAVRDCCIEMGASEVLVATLSCKDHGRRIDGIQSDFNGVMLPDRYVFGYGMDYQEQGRNLPGIYAMNATSVSAS